MKSGIVRRHIDLTETLNSVMSEDAGGTVLFIGTIRNQTNGKKVKGLVYEVYRRMAERRISELENEIRERWPIKAIRLVHREGRLNVGELSVVIAVSAPHRREAFEAARFAIEQIKTSLPIWKRETFAGGREAWAKGSQIQSRSRAMSARQRGSTRRAHRPKRILAEA